MGIFTASSVEDIFWVSLNEVYDWILVILFYLLTSILHLYAIAKFRNIYRALAGTRCFTDRPKQGGTIQSGAEPMVTIQISSFNEGNVIEDTINAACSVDWPKDQLRVQVLDDSTDETVEIIESVCGKWRENGVECNRYSRPDRIGYKAGCLHHHTDKIQGDFVAMFDSDHRCDNQFLRRCLPHFFNKKGKSKPKVGLVQCPWAYYNTHTNILTEYDALNLDTSFVLEQTGRSAALGVFSFNGTGGIWRKQAIQAGGGWSWETITEDLDLSYESYMKGYEFVYLRDLPQQLELPAGMRAHVQQKFRWTKGFFQVARKTLLRILRNPLTPILLKLEVFFHYTGAIAYTVTLMAVLLGPILAWRNLFSPFLIVFTIGPAVVPLIGGTCTVFGKVAGSNGHYKSFASRCKRMLFLPTLYIFAMGMMVFETHAIYDGLTSDDATFVRTPKEGTPVAGDQKLDYRNDEDECRNDDERNEDREDTNEADGNAIDDDVEDNEISNDTRSNGGDVEESQTREAETKEEPPSEAKRRCNPKLPRCWPKLSNKGQKFKTNFTVGMFGLLVACYLCCWCTWLFLETRKSRDSSSPEGIDMTAIAMTFFLPIPAIGLFCVHGWFMYSLLSMKFKSIHRKWASRREVRRALRLKMAGVSPSDDADTVNTDALSRRSRSSASVRRHKASGGMSLIRFLDQSFTSIDDPELRSLSSSIASNSPIERSRYRERRAGGRRPQRSIMTQPKANLSAMLGLSGFGDLHEFGEEEKQEDDDMELGNSSSFSYLETSFGEIPDSQARRCVLMDAVTPLPFISDDPMSDFESDTSGRLSSQEASMEGKPRPLPLMAKKERSLRQFLHRKSNDTWLPAETPSSATATNTTMKKQGNFRQFLRRKSNDVSEYQPRDDQPPSGPVLSKSSKEPIKHRSLGNREAPPSITVRKSRHEPARHRSMGRPLKSLSFGRLSSEQASLEGKKPGPESPRKVLTMNKQRNFRQFIDMWEGKMPRPVSPRKVPTMKKQRSFSKFIDMWEGKHQVSHGSLASQQESPTSTWRNSAKETATQRISRLLSPRSRKSAVLATAEVPSAPPISGMIISIDERGFHGDDKNHHDGYNNSKNEEKKNRQAPTEKTPLSSQEKEKFTPTRVGLMVAHFESIEAECTITFESAASANSNEESSIQSTSSTPSDGTMMTPESSCSSPSNRNRNYEEAAAMQDLPSPSSVCSRVTIQRAISGLPF